MKTALLLTAAIASVSMAGLAADKTTDSNSSAGSSSGSSETVGRFIDDSTITARVKSRFAQDANVSATSVRVETVNGVVQLAGFADSDQERAAAGDIARGVPGVKEVRNDIVVKKPGD